MNLVIPALFFGLVLIVFTMVAVYPEEWQEVPHLTPPTELTLWEPRDRLEMID